MVVGGALALAVSGVAVGLVGAALGTRLLSALLFGVTLTDPLTLLSASVAVAASYLPAWRATRVDPMVTLRG